MPNFKEIPLPNPEIHVTKVSVFFLHLFALHTFQKHIMCNLIELKFVAGLNTNPSTKCCANLMYIHRIMTNYLHKMIKILSHLQGKPFYGIG